MAKKIYVKLKDRTAVFHDMKTDTGVVSDKVVLIERTQQVQTALTGGVLVQVSAEDFKKYKNKLEKAEKAKAASEEEGKKPAETKSDYDLAVEKYLKEKNDDLEDLCLNNNISITDGMLKQELAETLAKHDTGKLTDEDYFTLEDNEVVVTNKMLDDNEDLDEKIGTIIEKEAEE